jgi:ribonuclease III
VGPDHDRQFTVKVLIDGKERGQGKGKSKQLAQQSAAQFVLEKEAA